MLACAATSVDVAATEACASTVAAGAPLPAAGTSSDEETLDCTPAGGTVTPASTAVAGAATWTSADAVAAGVAASAAPDAPDPPTVADADAGPAEAEMPREGAAPSAAAAVPAPTNVTRSTAATPAASLRTVQVGYPDRRIAASLATGIVVPRPSDCARELYARCGSCSSCSAGSPRRSSRLRSTSELSSAPKSSASPVSQSHVSMTITAASEPHVLL